MEIPKRCIWMVLVGAIVSVCYHDVQVPMKNTGTSPLNVRLLELDSHGNTLQRGSIGQLQANGTTSASITVHEGSDVQVRADIPQGFKVFDSANTTVSRGDPRPLKLPEVELALYFAHVPTDEKAVQQLGAAALDMGAVFDNLSASDLDSAAKKHVGRSIRGQVDSACAN